MERIALGKTLFERLTIEPTSSFCFFHYAMHVSTPRPHYHYHPEIELTLQVQGHGMRFVGDSVQSFGPGDLCLLGSNLLHSWAPGSSPQLVEAIGVQIRPETLTSAARQWPELRRLHTLASLCSHGVRICGRQATSVTRLLLQANKAPEGSVRRLSAVLEALEAACDPASHQPLSTACPLRPQGDASLSRFGRVIDALHAEMPHPPDQAAMARLVGLTPAGFSCFFRRFVGKSYVDYVNAWRISLACRQLLQTDLPITEIAFECGFENLSNFNRRFRQYKQTTPRDYRAAATLQHPPSTEVPAPLTEKRKPLINSAGS